MRLLDGHTGTVYALAFSHEGVLFSGGQDGIVREWSASAPGIAPFEKFASPVATIAVAPPQNVAIGGEFGAVIFDGMTRNVLVSSGPVCAIVACDGGRYFAVGHGDLLDPSLEGRLALFSSSTRKMVREYWGPSVLAAAATPDGKVVCWAGGDKRVSHWDITKQDRTTSAAHRRPIRGLALSPDARTIAATDDYAIRVYEADTMQEQRLLAGHKGRVDALTFTPDGRLLSGSWDKTVGVWDVQSGRLISNHDWDIGAIRSVAVSSDGLLAAAGGGRGTIALWDLE